MDLTIKKSTELSLVEDIISRMDEIPVLCRAVEDLYHKGHITADEVNRLNNMLGTVDRADFDLAKQCIFNLVDTHNIKWRHEK
ncbi:MAG: hypothetical protein E6Q36_02855 [Chryseobacterium sp.]|nr:MAG: hypothetical protein E6Q36_02855 [Chryseobacterium sp.]